MVATSRATKADVEPVASAAAKPSAKSVVGGTLAGDAAEPYLDSRTVGQLRQLAKHRGVTGYSRLTKAQLLVTLRS